MIETIFWIFLASSLGLSALLTILLVGKPRGPIEPKTAAISVFWNAVLIWGIVQYGILK